MKICVKKRTVVLVMLFLLLTATCSFASAKINAYSIEKTISDTLNAMEVPGCVRRTELEDYFAKAEDTRFVCYSSDDLEMVFHFDEESGKLLRADSYALLFPEEAEATQIRTAVLTDAEREEKSLALAEMLICGYQIGELKLEKISSTQLWDRFYVMEYYEGEPTGTTITIAWENDQIMSGIPHFGTVFSKDNQGRITRSDLGEKISEEEAIVYAIKAVEPCVSEYTISSDMASCDLALIGGSYCYEVKITIVKEWYDLEFIVILDAYTGEIQEIQQSV